MVGLLFWIKFERSSTGIFSEVSHIHTRAHSKSNQRLGLVDTWSPDNFLPVLVIRWKRSVSGSETTMPRGRWVVGGEYCHRNCEYALLVVGQRLKRPPSVSLGGVSSRTNSSGWDEHVDLREQDSVFHVKNWPGTSSSTHFSSDSRINLVIFCMSAFVERACSSLVKFWLCAPSHWLQAEKKTILYRLDGLVVRLRSATVVKTEKNPGAFGFWDLRLTVFSVWRQSFSVFEWYSRIADSWPRFLGFAGCDRQKC